MLFVLVLQSVDAFFVIYLLLNFGDLLADVTLLFDNLNVSHAVLKQFHRIILRHISFLTRFNATGEDILLGLNILILPDKE